MNILITGANRGIGLEFVRQYATTADRIFACCRDLANAEDLRILQDQHPNIELFPLDVTSDTDISNLQKAITSPIDLLINNAGILLKDSSFGKLSVEDLTQTFLVNAVAPLKLIEAFVEHLKKGQQKCVATVSSRMGSISDNTSGGYYSYRAGKVALNMLLKSAAVDLKEHGIKILILHPGWVKTRMGGEGAALTAAESVTGMRQVIEQYNPPLGEVMFYSYQNEQIPW